eukprot:gene28373-35160_t
MDVRETVREAEAPLGEDEDAYHVAAEYPMTWARLGRLHYVGDWNIVSDCATVRIFGFFITADTQHYSSTKFLPISFAIDPD